LSPFPRRFARSGLLSDRNRSDTPLFASIKYENRPKSKCARLDTNCG